MLINIFHGYCSFYVLGLLTNAEGATEGWSSLIFTSVVSSLSAGPLKACFKVCKPLDKLVRTAKDNTGLSAKWVDGKSVTD